jgi:hypothetical protein
MSKSKEKSPPANPTDSRLPQQKQSLPSDSSERQGQEVTERKGRTNFDRKLEVEYGPKSGSPGPTDKNARPGKPSRDGKSFAPRGGFREQKPNASEGDESEFQIVGGPLNEFDTRISTRVVCKKCRRVDHVSARVRYKKSLLCSACAQKELKTLEYGIQGPKPTKRCTCFTCQIVFDLPEHVEDDGEKVCRDCLAGIAGWSGSLSESPEDRGRLKSELRPAGTLFRKKKRAESQSE